MIKNKISGLILLFLFAFSPVLSESPALSEEVQAKGSDIKELTTKHVDKEAGFEVEFPKDWEVKTDVMGTDMIALSPSENEEDLFRENINIIHADLDSPITQEEYFRINMTSLEQLLTDYDLEQAEDVEVDGVKGKRLIYTHRMGVVNAKVMQYLILLGKNAYVITFTADPNRFDQYRGMFDQIVGSFKFDKES